MNSQMIFTTRTCTEKAFLRSMSLPCTNHTWRRHPWFRDAYRRRSPHHDWYLWSTTTRGYRGPWGQEVWHQLPWWQRGFRHFNYRAYYGIFWAGMPDLNLESPGATAAIFDAARFWPEGMVSWNRLLAGRFNDPLVGRDILNLP